MGEVARYAASNVKQESQEPTPATVGDDRVWIMRKHPRVGLRQAHAIVTIDWEAGVARASCGLELGSREIGDVPQGGCMPCVLCIAATPLPA